MPTSARSAEPESCRVCSSVQSPKPVCTQALCRANEQESESSDSHTDHDHTWHATEQLPSRTYQHRWACAAHALCEDAGETGLSVVCMRRQQPAIKGKNPFFNFKLHSDYCQAWTPPDRLVVGEHSPAACSCLWV